MYVCTMLFVKCLLEFGTWSKKFERCSSNPTSKWKLKALQLKELIERYTYTPGTWMSWCSWNVSAKAGGRLHWPGWYMSLQRESCEVGCSSAEGAFEEEVLGKQSYAMIIQNTGYHSRDPCICKENGPSLQIFRLLHLSIRKNYK